uniref:Crystallin, gamma S3 n=1 Tax=Oncorhynchus mykiss TaxID=8022 RepID=A0A8C7QQA9_ONCMY
MDRIGKIIFYEDKNFQGHHFECSSDCPELSSHLSRCNSIRVESGNWVLYERPNYLGSQYILTRGEYLDYQSWMGYNNNIRSCRIIRNLSPTQETSGIEAKPNLPEHWRHREVHWVFYEHPNYRGRQHLLERAEYRRFTEWNAMHPKVGSIRHVQNF